MICRHCKQVIVRCWSENMAGQPCEFHGFIHQRHNSHYCYPNSGTMRLMKYTADPDMEMSGSTEYV